MLLTPFIKRQLQIFTVIAAVALFLTFVNYARVPAMLGVGVYDVHAQFHDASGLYPKANVTYRGVRIGQVENLQIHDAGADATLQIDSKYQIPTDVSAQLHSTSAIGEQYIDLVPTSDAGPYLKDGATIPLAQTVDMPQISPVLDNLNNLLKSVPQKQTSDVLKELNGGLGGSGTDLGQLIDKTSDFTDQAQQQIDATTGLISALQPVLNTQQDLAGNTVAYAKALRIFTDQTATHDQDIRNLLRTGPPAIQTAQGLVNDLQPTLPTLLANLTTNAQVFNTYLPNLRQTLVIYPATVARLQSAVNPRAKEGDVQLDLRAALNNPPSCHTGYVPVDERRSPSVTSQRKVNGTAHCAVAPTNPSSVRGARNLPCPNNGSRAALPAGCGLHFKSGVSLGSVNARDAATEAMSGQVTTADGTTYRIDLPIAKEGDDAWKSLVLGPLGLN